LWNCNNNYRNICVEIALLSRTGYIVVLILRNVKGNSNFALEYLKHLYKPAKPFKQLVHIFFKHTLGSNNFPSKQLVHEFFKQTLGS